MIDLTQTMLIGIDIQNDFCPQGALAVNAGDEIIPIVNRLIESFDQVALTQDWHPAGHSSFASTHPDGEPFSEVQMSYGSQTLWPDHCVQGTLGAAFHRDLNSDAAQLIVRKGFRHAIDSYSAFMENDRRTTTGLAGYLREQRIQTVVLCGLAFDYCVAYSALDAIASGFECMVVTDACRSIDLNNSAAAAATELDQKGVKQVTSAALIEQLAKA